MILFFVMFNIAVLMIIYPVFSYHRAIMKREKELAERRRKYIEGIE